MKTVIFSALAVALMFVGSVVNAQCSSCGQQAVSFNQPIAATQSFVQPVSYNQPIAATQSFVQPVSYNQPFVAATPTFAQQATTGCSSCGQQAFAQPVSYNQPIATTQSFVQPVSYNQPVVSATPSFVQQASTGCSSCAQQSFVQPVSYSQPIATTAPAFAQPTGCTSCGQAPVAVTALNSNCNCSTAAPARGGFLRGGRTNGFGGPVSSRLIRGGIFSAIRNN